MNEQFTRFVDPAHQGATSTSASAGPAGEPEQKDFWDSFGQPPAGPPKERKDFWDDFAAAGEAKVQQSSKGPTSIGTSAMKTNASGGGGGKKEDDEWGAW
jgi:ADP-ribosylation factor GTPase-activating protein 1